MSKYYLVASHYNMYQKTYQDEIIVNLPSVDLSTIQAIDYFTSSHNRTELLQLIEQETNKHDLNHLAIKYYKNKDAIPNYFRVIEDNSELSQLLKENQTYLSKNKNARTTEYYLSGRTYRFSAVNPNNPYFLKELRKILKIIEAKNLSAFETIYPYHNDTLHFLVTRYINASYDNEFASQEELKLIMKEFSRYKTFRGWVVAIEKRSKILKKPKPTVLSNFNIQENPPKKAAIKTKTIEEYSEDYAKDFEEKHGMNYQSYQTMKHNLSYLEEDKEEFLEDSEIDNMYDEEQEMYQSYTPQKRK